MESDCIFCHLIREDSANWVAIEEHAVAFEPLREDLLAPGHTLVIPRNHREGLFGPSESELAAVMHLVRRVAAAMRTELRSTGTFLIQASGPDSGGTVPHLHFHVVPCWADDNADFWPKERSAHPSVDRPHTVIRSALRAVR
ncbi:MULTISPECIES: HIT family protein [Microbacterium]|uniref:HIT family protein n=1 Tax=Microbacterium wangchenii TaxID=2541726 RepID=A0ABX5SZ05_9MICO|nr:HIT family protein [Microbacterium sp. EYE_512]QBR90079.1 HIT family protein [Microbacterium wangchenii]